MFNKNNHFHTQSYTHYCCMHWNSGNLQSNQSPIKSTAWTRLSWFTELNGQISVIRKRFPKDSLIHTPTHWTREEWILVMSKRFTDSNTDQLNGREVNQDHDQKIQWFKQWPAECERNESWSCLKDSLTQTLTHRMRDERILLMAERFTDSNTDSMNERSELSLWPKHSLIQTTEPLNDLFTLVTHLVTHLS